MKMGIKLNQTIIFVLLFSLLIICFFNQKTVLIKRGSEVSLITTYKKNIDSLIKAYNSDFTIHDLISPDKNMKLRDGMIIVIKNNL